MHHVVAASILAAFAPFAAAQCQFTAVGTQSHGQGCNRVFGSPPSLTFTLDTSACNLDVTVAAFPGCCNTFLVGSLLALGDQPTFVPLPEFGPGCALLVVPLVIAFQPNASGPTFTLPLPPGLPPITFEAQGGVLYFTTIGLTNDFALTEGSQVTLQ